VGIYANDELSQEPVNVSGFDSCQGIVEEVDKWKWIDQHPRNIVREKVFRGRMFILNWFSTV